MWQEPMAKVLCVHYIQAILEAEGKKTGFFTSPHLISINERIQIGREPIDNEKFYQVFEHVYDVVKKWKKREFHIHPILNFYLAWD